MSIFSPVNSQRIRKLLCPSFIELLFQAYVECNYLRRCSNLINYFKSCKLGCKGFQCYTGGRLWSERALGGLYYKTNSFLLSPRSRVKMEKVIFYSPGSALVLVNSVTFLCIISIRVIEGNLCEWFNRWRYKSTGFST